MQEGFGSAPAIESNYHLRSVATAFVHPGQIFHIFGQVNMLVVREATRSANGRAGRHCEIRNEIVYDGALAAAVCTGDSNECRTIG
jgi:hypothetical protein